MKADAEVQLYMRDQKREEEKKREQKEVTAMFEHSAKLEKQLKERESAKKEQLKKIQQENLQIALTKKNIKVQEKVGDSLKEKDLVDSNAFANKNLEVR